MLRPDRTNLRRALALGAAALLATVSCGRDVTGPHELRAMRGFSFEPVFSVAALADGVASTVVPFDRVRLRLTNSVGRVVVDSVVPMPSGAPDVSVALTVPLTPGASSSGEAMTLTLAYVNAQGDTVFRGGPTSVRIVPTQSGTQPPPVPQVPVAYVGPGANATQVQIAGSVDSVLSGNAFSYTATARDAQGQPIVGTPIAWSVTPATRATIANPASGAGTTSPSRGPALVIAQLLTGPADTLQLEVLPRAQSLASVSGDAQVARLGAVLPQPLVVRVNATDGQPMAGVSVAFAVTAGGGSLSAATVVSDAQGLASVTWTTGNALGAQTVTASVSGLTGSPVTFTATAPVLALTFVQQPPTTAPVGLAMSPPVTVAVRDGQGTIATSYTGPVSIALGANAAGAVLGGTTTVNAVAGVATFSTLTIDRAGTGFTLVATASGLGLTSPPSAAFAAAIVPARNSWINPAGGSWSVATNWSLARVPVAADTVAIDLDGTYTVTLDAAVTVGVLQVGGGTGTKTFNAVNQTLTVNTLLQTLAGGRLVTGGGVINGTGTLSNGGQYVANGGTVRIPLSNLGLVLVRGGLNQEAPLTTAAGSTIEVRGNGEFGPSGMNVTAGFTNNGSIALTSSDGPWDAAFTVTSGALVNAPGASLVAVGAAGGNRYFSGTLDNRGSVNVQTFTFFTLTGTANVNVGSISVSQTLNVGFSGAGALTNEGTVSITGGILALSSGTWAQTASGTMTGAAAFSVSSGATLRLLGATIASPVLNSGNIEAADASSLNGALTMNTGSLLRVAPTGASTLAADLTIANGFTNAGTIELTNLLTASQARDASVAIVTGTLTNAAGGTLRTLPGNGGGARTIFGSLTNQGLLQLAPGTAGTLAVTGAFATSGTLSMDIGGVTPGTEHDRLILSSSATLGGTLNVGLFGGFTPAAGSTFALISAGTVTGTFATVNAATPLQATPVYSATAVTVNGPTAALVNAWTNATGGTWSTASNWSLGRTPLASDTVQIALDGTYTVTMDVGDTVAALFVGGASGVQTLAVGTRTLRVGTLLQVGTAGSVSLVAGGVLTGPATLANLGTVTSRGSIALPVTNSGTFVIGGTGSVSGAFVNAAGATLRSLASAALGGGASPTMPGGLTNAGTLELQTLDAFYSHTLTVSGTLVNQTGGVIRPIAGFGGKTLAAQLDNRGTVDMQEVLTLAAAGAQHLNSGTIEVAAANLSVTQTGTTPSFTNTGTINILTGRTLSVTGGTLTLTGGTLFGAGTGTLATNGVTLNTDFASASARLTLTSTTVPGTFTIPPAGALQLNDGSPSMTLVNNGRLILAGSVVLGGTLTTGDTTSIIEVRAAATYGGGVSATITNGFTNTGIIELRTTDAFYANSLTITTGTLVNAPGGIIRPIAGNGGKTLAAQLNNQGLLDVRETLALSRASAVHANSGTINLALANLTVTQSGTTPSFTNTGTINVPNGRTFAVSGGTLTLTGGVLNGNTTGVLQTTNTTVNADIASARARWTLTTSTVPGTFTIPAGDSLQLNDGSPSMTLVNNGRLILAGSVVLGGTLTTGDTTSIIEVRAAATYGGGVSATITNGFTNTGIIELRTTDAFYANSLTITTGTLVNAPGGIVRSVAGFGGKTLAARLDNQGRLDVREALTLARASATHVNSGTIDLVLANLTVTQSGTTPSFTNTGTITIPNGRTFAVSGGTLTLTGGTLNGNTTGVLQTTNTTVNADIASARARWTLTTSTVPGTFTIPAGDSLQLNDGSPTMTLVNNGRLILAGSVVLGGTVTTGDTTSVVEVRAAATYGGGANATITNGFTNTGRIEQRTVDAFYANSLTITTGTLVNAPGGIIRAIPGFGGKTLAAQLDNQGLLDVRESYSLSRASAVHTNSGTIALTVADLTVTQSGTTPSFTNTGTITLANGRTFAVSGGTLTLTGGTLNGATTGRLQTTNTTVNTDIASARARWTLTTSTVPGTFTIPVGDSLQLNDGSPTMTLVNNGRLILAGSVVLGGTVTTGGASSVIETRASASFGGGVTATITNGFTNTGLIELRTLDAFYANSLTITNGTLLNASTGVIRTIAGNGGKTLAARLDNQGLVEINEPLSLTRASAAHVNSGTINLVLANLTVTQSGTTPSFTNSGTINVPNGRTFAVSGGTLTLTGGALNGNTTGVLQTTNTTVNADIASARARWTLTTSTVPGTFTIPALDSLQLVDGSPTMTLVNNGRLILAGSAVLGGTLTTGDTTSVVEVRAAATYGGGANATITNGFTNTGRIELRTLDAFYANSLTITTGTLVNAPGGIIRSIAGNGGKTLAARLDNQGLLDVREALNLSRASAVHLNSGTIDLVSGNLTVTQSGTTPSFTNTGTIVVPTGRTFTNTGGTLDFTTGAFGGQGGLLSTTGTTFNFTVPSMRAPATLNSTTVPGTLVIGATDTLKLNDGSPTMTIQSNGFLSLSGGVTLGGTLTSGVGSTVEVLASAATGGGTNVTVTNAYTNNGTLRQVTADAAYSNGLTFTNGTFVNASTGTVISSGIGSRSMSAAGGWTNNGTWNVNNSLSIGSGAFAQNQTLTIATGATLTLAGALTLNGGLVTVNGTLVKNGGCTGSPALITGSGTGASCP